MAGMQALNRPPALKPCGAPFFATPIRISKGGVRWHAAYQSGCFQVQATPQKQDTVSAAELPKPHPKAFKTLEKIKVQVSTPMFVLAHNTHTRHALLNPAPLLIAPT